MFMVYYQNFGHSGAFYNTVTKMPLLDEKLRQLVEVFGFHSDGYAAARSKLVSLGGMPAGDDRE